MPYPIPGRCPVCGKEMTVTELHCKSCRMTLNGDFTLCEFCSLTPQQRALLKNFVATGGSIKELEGVLGVSYPTVKKRLAELAQALGVSGHFQKTDSSQLASERATVLEKLSKGEISADDAIRRMDEIATQEN